MVPKLRRSYKGVGQDEYDDVIKGLWVPEGTWLVQHSGKCLNKVIYWQLQQDNGKPHTTPKNMVFTAPSMHMPGSHFQQIHLICHPLRQCGLAKLRKDHKPKSVEEL